MRDSSTSLGKTTKRQMALLCSVFLVGVANAQESPMPLPALETSPVPTVSPTISESPVSSASPTPSASPIPTTSPARSVRISFLPPPLEGKISVGIYDQRGQLVCVLHREAKLEDFSVGEDALVTKWDGRDNSGADLPAGRYRARGYLVGNLKLEEIGNSTALPAEQSTTAQVRLMANPLARDAKTIVDLAVGFDDKSSYLKTTDGLPLFAISQNPKIVRAFINKSGEKSVDVWEDDGTSVAQFRISNIDKMVAFDCGAFELN